MNMVEDPLVIIGISANSLTFSSSEFRVVTNMMLSTRRLPAGVIALFFATASTTWSGEILYRRNFSGSTLTTTDLELAPKGGGAERPATVANMGLTLVKT